MRVLSGVALTASGAVCYQRPLRLRDVAPRSASPTGDRVAGHVRPPRTRAPLDGVLGLVYMCGGVEEGFFRSAMFRAPRQQVHKLGIGKSTHVLDACAQMRDMIAEAVLCNEARERLNGLDTRALHETAGRQ